MRIIILGLAWTLAAGIAAAETQKDSAERDVLFDKIDRDADKRVSKSEFLEFFKEYYKKIDLNGDGVHVKSEHTRTGQFDAFDADGDGKITPEEDQTMRKKHFASLDKDGDEYLTLQEFEQS